SRDGARPRRLGSVAVARRARPPGRDHSGDPVSLSAAAALALDHRRSRRDLSRAVPRSRAQAPGELPETFVRAALAEGAGHPELPRRARRRARELRELAGAGGGAAARRGVPPARRHARGARPRAEHAGAAAAGSAARRVRVGAPPQGGEVSAPLSLIGFGETDAQLRAELCARVAKRAGRAVEWIAAAPGGSPGGSRNAAVARAGGAYALFVDEREEFATTFVEQACRVLDRRAEVAFVTGWLDGVPSRADDPPRELDAAMLLGRPWFAHVPTVFRKSAWQEARGFDESMSWAADVDLWLRLLERGRAGV